jgi:hypothetical protein
MRTDASDVDRRTKLTALSLDLSIEIDSSSISRHGWSIVSCRARAFSEDFRRDYPGSHELTIAGELKYPFGRGARARPKAHLIAEAFHADTGGISSVFEIADAGSMRAGETLRFSETVRIVETNRPIDPARFHVRVTSWDYFDG